MNQARNLLMSAPVLAAAALALSSGCQTVDGGARRADGALISQYQEPAREIRAAEADDSRYIETLRDTRLSGAETAVASLRNEFDASSTALSQRIERSEQAARDGDADTRAEIAALRNELSAMRKKLDAMPGTISALVDGREKELAAYVDRSMKASEQRTSASIAAARNASARSAGGGASQYSGPAYEHKVQSGETLSEIAQAYSREYGKTVSVAEILAANNIKDASRLRVDQVILIPKK